MSRSLLQQPVLLALRAGKQLQLLHKALQARKHQALPCCSCSCVPDHLARPVWRPDFVSTALGQTHQPMRMTSCSLLQQPVLFTLRASKQLQLLHKPLQARKH